MSSYVIAATGTEIGKTFVTCALVYGSGRQAFKPVITGFSGVETDAHRLIEAMRGAPSPQENGFVWGMERARPQADLDEEIARIAPWRYAAPLSPDMAAAREGKTLRYRDLVAWSRLRDECFIETVGGIMVPLDERHTTLDWMVAMGLPVILVAGSYLGTLSHTLTALEVLRAAQLQTWAVVLNESRESTVGLEETRASLANHTDALIVVQPRVSSYRNATAIHALARNLP